MSADCQGCGHPNRSGARFCAQCGGDLSAARATRDGAPGEATLRRSLTAPSYQALRGELWPVAALMLALMAVNLGTAVAAMVVEDVAAGPGWVATLWMDVAILVFVIADRRALRPLLSTARLGLSSIAGVPIGFVVLLGAMTLYQLALRPFGIHFSDDAITASMAGSPSWVVFFLLSVNPALFEELAFRGVISERLSRVFGRNETLVLQAALFAVAHMLPLMFVSHFVMGLVLGFLRQHTGSLYAGMLLHALWNASVVLG